MQRLREQRYDAVTLDILMPGMDGFEVLRQIRADPELRSTPILFVSVFAGGKELAGEWVVSKPIDADELRDVLAAAVRAGRSRVLVVGREKMQPALEPALDELGIEHHWETTGAAAARVCGERRFEVALIDVGIRNPQAALQALDLRGRRLRRAVILFSDVETPTPSGIVNLGMEVVPVEDAARALLAALRGDRDSDKPGERMELRTESELSHEIAVLRAELARRDRDAAEHERQLERYAADLRETFKQERVRTQQLTRSYMATVRALSNAVEARDAYTGKHAERVAAYGIEIARALGLPRPDAPELEFGFLLHDIGKLAIPDAILYKPGELTEEERALMARHPAIGAEIVGEIEFLAEAARVVRSHHERWDGSGYPDGLAGEEIPLAARVFAVADVLDALTTDRPYRPASRWARRAR